MKVLQRIITSLESYHRLELQDVFLDNHNWLSVKQVNLYRIKIILLIIILSNILIAIQYRFTQNISYQVFYKFFLIYIQRNSSARFKKYCALFIETSCVKIYFPQICFLHIGKCKIYMF
jgi:hypothetical protein